MNFPRCLLLLVASTLISCAGDKSTSVPTGPDGKELPTDDLRVAWSHGTCKGSGVVRYAVSPMALADVREFVPLGIMGGGHVTPVDHQYFSPIVFNSPRSTYNVVAPFNGSIVQIQPRVKRAEDPGPAPVGSVDYRVMFEGSCTFWVYYDLLTDLEPSIKTAGGADLAANKSVNVRIPVTAGQLIGKVGGQTLDLGTVNADITLPGLLIPDHYKAEPWKIHSVDALDYFDEPLRSQLLAINRRKANPRGGKIDYDIDGAASGNWFLLGTGGYGGNVSNGLNYWTGHLAFAYGSVDPNLVMISMGFPDASSKQWAVKGNGPDPATVTSANGVVKYELIQQFGDSASQLVNQPTVGVMAIQVLAGRQLRVEYFPNAVASSVSGFTANAKIYER